MKRKLVVIGNAEPTEDHSAFIDQCDTVIRFNRTPFFDTGKTGSKTTILCLSGLNYPIIGGEIPGLNQFVVEDCNTIWAENDLFSKPLARGYGIASDKIHLMNLSGIRDPEEIQTKNSRLIKRPSSGFQALRYLVNCTLCADTDKFITGFTFEGGPLHQWEYEKEQVERYVELVLLSWVK